MVLGAGWMLGVPSLTAPCCPELAAGAVPVPVEALREGAELRVGDAETHPPGAPGVRRGWDGGGAGCQAGFCFNPTSIPHYSPPHPPRPCRRQAELEQSDGEEDFYYTELDSGLDSLTDGLSGLTPGSPTASVPPAFPRLELPEPLALPSLLRLPALPPPSVLSTTSPSQVCPSDHAHQVGEAAGGSQGARGHSSTSSQGCLAPIHLEPQPTPVRACAPALLAKPSANPRCVCVEGPGWAPGREGPSPNSTLCICVFPQEAPG